MIRNILDKLFPLTMFVAAATTGSSLYTAVQRRAWFDVAGCLVTAIVLFFLTRSWLCGRRAWWRTADYQARHATFVQTLTDLTRTGPYIAWHADTRQWLGVAVCTTPLPAIFSGRRYFTVIVVDDPEPSLASGTDIEFDYVTSRCFLVFRRNPCIEIHVTGELVDPRTGHRHPVAGGPRGTLRAVIGRLRTPPADRLAGSSDIDALLEQLATAEPRERH
ncbi:hypothetical protein IU501_33030 [Nocardia otitidiscaviarum]|uniref:hypothetical protein n=1 Tax=Nocardia otitidiscaviarum TaxID=1823 RepID=UPI0004A78704|nr:hypothetical protein [Nocardia otitidiscaviarum]MBF6137797.1 hypothetical protein [Nocardia otitidiscaviarum]MBF6485320.1 hypothetical protein [Nocardia otitidiscaviarum]